MTRIGLAPQHFLLGHQSIGRRGLPPGFGDGVQIPRAQLSRRWTAGLGPLDDPLVCDCRRPVLAVGDGHWVLESVRAVFPDTRELRCWWHKQAEILAALPKSAHPGALAAMREIYDGQDIDKAQVAIKASEIDYGVKYRKAVATISGDTVVLLESRRAAGTTRRRPGQRDSA